MRGKHDKPKRRLAGSSGFTLIEMLVSVTLVLLLMVMFAEIFGLVTGSMTKQQGLSRNDRRGRTTSIVIKSDLEKRTFRALIPFDRGENFQGIDPLLSKRLGYFYISENDPNNDTDDVIQFTILTSIATPHGPDTSPLTGRIGNFGFLGFIHPTPSNPTAGAAVWAANTNYVVGNVVVPVISGATGLPDPPYRFICVDGGDSGTGQPAWTSLGGSKVVDYEAEWMIEGSNQPEWDDGFLNNSMSSPLAEVVYYLRNGNLYRRVVLIRDPVSGDSQPGNGITGQQYFDRNSSFYATNASFYQDFDLSAHYGSTGATVHGRQSLENKYVNPSPKWRPGTIYRHDDIVIPIRANNQFLIYQCRALPDGFGTSDGFEPNWPTGAGGTVVDNGVTWEAIEPPYRDINNNGVLDFGDELIGTGGVKELPLGMPYFRFGYHHLDLSTAVGLGSSGRPREYVGGYFIGRFTQEETSHDDFRYPHRTSTVGSATGAFINNGFPYVEGAAQNPLTVGADGVIDQYRGGPRRGEDILLTNVHSFDVKVWDDGYIVSNPGGIIGDCNDIRGEWVDIGDDVGLQGSGFYSFAAKGRNLANHAYGPHPIPAGQTNPVGGVVEPVNRVFDTWHPALSADAPLRPMLMYRDSVSLLATSHTLDAQFLRGTWTPDAVSSSSSDDRNPGAAYVNGHLVVPTGATSLALVYQATPTGTNPQNLTGYVEPLWPIEAGQSVFSSPEDINNNGKLDTINEDTNGNNALDPGEDQDLDGVLDFSEDANGDGVLTGYRWTAIANLRPLRAIRITIRYHDIKSDQVRQLTIVHSLVDNR